MKLKELIEKGYRYTLLDKQGNVIGGESLEAKNLKEIIEVAKDILNEEPKKIKLIGKNKSYVVYKLKGEKLLVLSTKGRNVEEIEKIVEGK